MRSLLLLRFGWFSLSAAAFSLSACGANHDDLSKRLATLQSDVTRLQHHSSRLEERLEALEIRKTATSPPARTAAGDATANLERPRLMVVKLEPGDETREASSSAPIAALPVEQSTTDQSPRPLIRVYGSRTDVDSGQDSSKRKR
jgi:hypothetical protein